MQEIEYIVNGNRKILRHLDITTPFEPMIILYTHRELSLVC